MANRYYDQRPPPPASRAMTRTITAPGRTSSSSRGGYYQYGDQLTMPMANTIAARTAITIAGTRASDSRAPTWRASGPDRGATYDPLDDYDRASYAAGYRPVDRRYEHHADLPRRRFRLRAGTRSTGPAVPPVTWAAMSARWRRPISSTRTGPSLRPPRDRAVRHASRLLRARRATRSPAGSATTMPSAGAKWTIAGADRAITPVRTNASSRMPATG